MEKKKDDGGFILVVSMVRCKFSTTCPLMLCETGFNSLTSVIMSFFLRISFLHFEDERCSL